MRTTLDRIRHALLFELIGLCLFVLIFSICMFIVRLILKTARFANDVPVLGTMNRVGGALLGCKGAHCSIFALFSGGFVFIVHTWRRGYNRQVVFV